MHPQDSMDTTERQARIERLRGTRVQPPLGNYGGGTYSPPTDPQDYSAHEAQSSDLAAQEGGILLDYLRVRLPDTRETWQALGEWLGTMTARAVGWRGWYDQSYTVLDGGLVACCSDPDRAQVEGVLVDLPGKACAHLGGRLIPFLAWCCEHGTVTRADWALDDRKGLLSLERILEADEKGAIVTRWQGLTVIQNRQRGQRRGWTVYIGSRSSEAFCRIYDKAAEQGRDGVHWVRFEFETKGAFADALAREVLAHGAGAVVQQINRRIRFVQPSPTDSNTRRAKVASWWGAFIGSVRQGASLLCGEKVQTTISAMAAWVERQAGPALATIIKAARGDMGDVWGIVERSERRLKPKHHAALALVGAGV